MSFSGNKSFILYASGLLKLKHFSHTLTFTMKLLLLYDKILLSK